MIKEKMQKIVNNKWFGILLITIINVILFIICNKLFTPRYEQVDDFMIMNLISEMDGNYTVYGVQMHPIICGIIILLYKTGININWYTIFLLTIQFISFTVIGIVFWKKNKRLGLPLYICFVVIMYAKMLRYIQYTTVSMLAIASGVILLMYSIDNIKEINKSSLIFGIIMIILGAMIRLSTIIIAIPFILLYFVFKLLKDKNINIIKIGLISIVSILLVNISFNVLYNINPIYKDFLEFHDVRTYLHDYNWMYYDNNKEIFDSIDWSENDRDIFYAYCFGDEEVYNTQELEKLKESALKNKNETNILQKCAITFKNFTSEVKDDTYKYIFLTVAILIIFNNLFIVTNKSETDKDNRNNNIKIGFVNLIFLGIIGIHCLFIFLGRPMFRVIISTYIIGIIMLMYELLEKPKINATKIIAYIFIIFMIFTSVLEFKQNVKYASYYNIENYSGYKKVLEYTNSHKENAYLYTLVMRDRFLAYSIYEKVPDNTFSNIRPLGDWDTYTDNYYDFKERYNLDNLMEDLYKNDNVYLISGKVIWSEKYEEYITIIKRYIKEHYNVDVRIDLVKEFENNIKIYKLYEE